MEINVSKKGLNIPKCIGFIMDGNRRFAREKGMSPLLGHVEGEKTFSESIKWLEEIGVPHGVYYAFSTENWRRSPEEIEYLFKQFELFLKKILSEIDSHNVNIKVIGRKSDLPEKLQVLIKKVENSKKKKLTMTVWVALSYGGRAEIIAGVNEAIKKGELVDEVSFSKLLWGADLPEPDLIIRTGGEQRLSNFLTWHSVYSELYFTKTYWPAFSKNEFRKIINEYTLRQRRRGK